MTDNVFSKIAQTLQEQMTADEKAVFEDMARRSRDAELCAAKPGEWVGQWLTTAYKDDRDAELKRRPHAGSYLDKIRREIDAEVETERLEFSLMQRGFSYEQVTRLIIRKHLLRNGIPIHRFFSKHPQLIPGETCNNCNAVGTLFIHPTDKTVRECAWCMNQTRNK